MSTRKPWRVGWFALAVAMSLAAVSAAQADLPIGPVRGATAYYLANEIPASVGQPVAGLKLTLSADKTELAMSALQLRRATEDTPHYGCETVKLTLIFTNVSDKPIKLNGYDVEWSRLKVHVQGPADKSVRGDLRMVERRMRAMEPRDFPTLEPGKTWSMSVNFPGVVGEHQYRLMRPGGYKVAIGYAWQVAPDQPLADFAKGAWTGEVVSNAVELTAVAPPGEALFGPVVNGLKLGLALPKYDFAAGEGVIKANVVLANASDKPILALPLLVNTATVDFVVTGPDGRPIPYRGPMLDWDVPDYDQAVKELAPGESVSKELGLGGFDVSRPGRYTVTVTYNWSNAKPPPGRKPAEWTRGPIWTGKLTSGPLAFTVAAAGEVKPSAGAADGKQGVEGQVVKLVGDFMPGEGPVRGQRSPMIVPVHVFRGKVKIIETPNPKHPQLVRVVQSDKDGRFKLSLPPGEYTIVAEIAGKLYLNSMDGEGHWTTVTVKPDEWTRWVIEDSSEATF